MWLVMLRGKRTLQNEKLLPTVEFGPTNSRYVALHAIHYYSDLMTINVVIFAGGKFRENIWKTFHAGAIFTKLLFPS